ncbi:hypothetical protein KP509_11G064500 [Ceratopteris richardii]|uniref:Uncharacterized protein n=1 Tax=Ceratopteris richardii TaxID=49495 RepID=A0A8T2TW37_CERRI|nr:hypothetical protein KP509_11G064500 [Ceratopteris richardii]
MGLKPEHKVELKVAADGFEGQGRLYAPPPSATSARPGEQNQHSDKIQFYYEGVRGDGVNSDSGFSGGIGNDVTPKSDEHSMKMAVERAMAKLKSTIHPEFLDRVVHAVVSIVQEAGASTKDTMQRVSAYLSEILPAIVDEVQDQMLLESSSPEPSSKL